MIADGRAHKFGDNVDTDVIIPGRYMTSQDEKFLAAHCLEGLDPTFAQRARPGDILVAGAYFGCGSSREHAPIAIRALGISCVLAASFARIFYRNAINIGLPIAIAPEAVAAIADGDRVRVDFDRGVVSVRGRDYSAQPFPPFVQELVAQGGLVEFVRRELARAARPD